MSPPIKYVQINVAHSLKTSAPEMESYLLGLITLEFGVCADISGESNIRNHIASKEVVYGISIRVERRVQGFPDGAVHHTRKCCCA